MIGRVKSLKEMQICYDLEEYIRHNIIPEYHNFDKAHGAEHVAQVMDKSLFLAEKIGADRKMAYVAAAYHDIGMKISRKEHGIHSARILKADACLPRWFSEEQLCIMAQAVEDHSKSLEQEPRSLYGKIIYQADVVLDAETVIKRSILFGIAHYKDYSFKEQVERVYKYINDKYGENGLFRLWIDIPQERLRLQQLREKIKDWDYVYGICQKYK